MCHKVVCDCKVLYINMWNILVAVIFGAVVPAISVNIEDGFHHRSNSSSVLGEFAINRDKRQLACGMYQWKCRDGNCIKFDGKCDGVVDCQDGSDETYPHCKNMVCQENFFRCTYGACVEGTAPCNGKQNCRDNSDELLPKCLNVTKTAIDKFKCDNEQMIASTNLCDGVPDCIDGSDETIKACAGNTCLSFLFQCAYGACVNHGSDCDNKQDCADNSDESDELCNRTSSMVSQSTESTSSTSSPSSGDCELPPHPANGKYKVQGDDFAQPGNKYSSVLIRVECNPGYAVNGNNEALCFGGTWHDIPQCLRYCKLEPHHSVTYNCLTSVGNSQITRPCNDIEFPNTKVIPKCREPTYHGTLSNMICSASGTWNYVARCTPDCGKITPDGQEYVIDGRRAKHGELPWHAGIYRKGKGYYKQICGGSLTSTTTIITAAHCFWVDFAGKMPAVEYAVALGKVYRPWNETHDRDAQFSNVSEIHIPTEFRGSSNNFQYDIAILILETPITYQTFIRPVCVNFDNNLNNMQLTTGNLGKIAGWGLTSADGNASPVLQVVELPYVTYSQCFEESPDDFRAYITADKICAGYLNGTALCQGDSGGGLVFSDLEKGYKKYYLRGIVSTAPRNEHKCNSKVRTTFTSIVKHEEFIRNYVNFNE